MNLAETAGGSSRKGQENGDAPNESERPLKKARFAWQVKGKYHLKNDLKDTNTKSTDAIAAPDVAGSSSSASSDNNNIGSEENLEIIGDYLMRRDFNTLDSVYTTTDQSFLLPKPNISNEELSYPRYVSSYEQNMVSSALKRTSESTDEMNMVPMSMVVSQNFAEEQCIARWQAKQMVKGFVDNSINHVLDFWIQAPLPPEDEPSRYVALDVADFINNLPGDNSIENEGILMAISAHGLQQPTRSNSTNLVDGKNTNNVSEDSDHFQPLTPQPSDDESHEPVNINNQYDTDTSSNNIDMPWSYSDDHKNGSDDMTAFQLFPDPSLSYQTVGDTNQNSSTECDGIDNSNCDFLDAAILFAIQSKGLTTFGSDYG